VPCPNTPTVGMLKIPVTIANILSHFGRIDFLMSIIAIIAIPVAKVIIVPIITRKSSIVTKMKAKEAI